MLDGQPYKKKLSPDQTKMIIDAAVLPPDEKKKTIERKGLAAVGLVARNNPKLVSLQWSLDDWLTNVRAEFIRLEVARFVAPQSDGSEAKEALGHGGKWYLTTTG